MLLGFKLGRLLPPPLHPSIDLPLRTTDFQSVAPDVRRTSSPSYRAAQPGPQRRQISRIEFLLGGHCRDLCGDLGWPASGEPIAVLQGRCQMRR